MRAMAAGVRRRTSAASFRQEARVVPERRARSPAPWMVLPSAMGSEKGIPISRMSAPPAAQASAISREVARSGSPAIT